MEAFDAKAQSRESIEPKFQLQKIMSTLFLSRTLSPRKLDIFTYAC